MHRIFHTGPYLRKYFYFPAKQLDGYNKLVAMGSLKFDWLIFYGLTDPTAFTANWLKSGNNVQVMGDGKKLAQHWWGIFKLTIQSFEAGISFKSLSGQDISCRVIGLSKCNLGGTNSPKRNELKIEYDNVIIHYPFKQAHGNEWREIDTDQTLEFKTFLAPDCGGLSKEERSNITTGIDYLMSNSRDIRSLIVMELRDEFRDWTLDLVRRKVKQQQ